jgi:plasmid stabilization system protein ParE
LAEAEAEAQEAARWYEERQLGLGLEFLDSLTKALEAVENHPHYYPPLAVTRPAREVRRALLGRFPYKIIFEIRADEVLVLAVAHAKRRPNYWKKRLS